MKKTILMALLTFLGVQAHAQGTYRNMNIHSLRCNLAQNSEETMKQVDLYIDFESLNSETGGQALITSPFGKSQTILTGGIYRENNGNVTFKGETVLYNQSYQLIMTLQTNLNFDNPTKKLVATLTTENIAKGQEKKVSVSQYNCEVPSP